MKINIKNNRLPLVIIVAGLILSVLLYLVTGIKLAPTVKEAEFELTVHYTLDGEAKNYVSKYTCRFDGHGDILDPLGRVYVGEYADYSDAVHGGSYTVASKDGYDLAIVTSFSDSYLMGDTGDEYYGNEVEDPFFVVYDADGVPSTSSALIALFDAEITSWENPTQVDNSFVFAGFAMIHETTMLLAILVGILVIVACTILVKREDVVYKTIDKLGIILNLVILFIALPFMTLIVWLMQVYSVTPESFAQFYLTIPAVTLFAIAASISLRRLGRARLGFFIQLLGPAMFLLLIVTETIFFYSV